LLPTLQKPSQKTCS